MTVKICADKIEGTLSTSLSRVLNLSSCPSGVLTLMLARVPDLPEKIQYAPLIPTLMYNTKTKEIITQNKPTAVVVVYDEDDKSIDLKLKGLKDFARIKVAERIVFMVPKGKNQSEMRNGTARVLCNPHHTDEIKKSLGVTSNNLDNPSEVGMVIVHKTTSCYLTSIAGLINAVIYYKIPYRVEETITQLPQSWMYMSRDDFYTKWSLMALNANTTDEPKTKRNWRMSMGYTCYITTEKGPKLMAPKGDEGIFARISTVFVNCIAYIIMLIIGFVKSVTMGVRRLYTYLLRKTTQSRKKEGSVLKKPKKRNK